MPDPIKDLYNSVKTGGLFIDENDFRTQLTKSPKEIFPVVSSLFIDYNDFENQVGLKKKDGGIIPQTTSEVSVASPSPSVSIGIDPEELRKRYERVNKGTQYLNNFIDQRRAADPIFSRSASDVLRTAATLNSKGLKSDRTSLVYDFLSKNSDIETNDQTRDSFINSQYSGAYYSEAPDLIKEYNNSDLKDIVTPRQFTALKSLSYGRQSKYLESLNKLKDPSVSDTEKQILKLELDKTGIDIDKDAASSMFQENNQEYAAKLFEKSKADEPLIDEQIRKIDYENPYTLRSFSNIIKGAVNRGLAVGGSADLLTATSNVSGVDVEKLASLQKDLQESKSSMAYENFSNDPSFDNFKKNPIGIMLELSLESLASLYSHGATRMAAGAGTGAALGSVVPGIGTAAGASTGVVAGLGMASLNLEYSSKILESLSAMGVNTADAQSLKNAFADGKTMSKLKEDGLKKGIPVALFDMLSAGIAGKIISKPAKSIAGKVMQGVAETGVQSALGAAGEASGQLVSEGKISNPNAVLMEAIGELGPGAVEIAYGNVVESAKRNKPINKADLVNVVSSNNKELIRSNIEAQVASGNITREQANVILNQLSSVETNLKKVPSDLSNSAKASTIELVEQKAALVEQSKNLDDAFKPEIEQKIKQIDEQILQITQNDKNATTESQVQITGTEGNISQPQGTIQGQPEVGQGTGQQGQATQQTTNVGDSNIGSQGQVVSPELADIERRRDDELKEYEGRRAAEFVKLNSEGPNQELTEDEINEVEDIIQAAINSGKVTADRLWKMLSSQGYTYSPYGSAKSTLAYLKNRLSGKTKTKVGGNLIEDTIAKYKEELAALEGNKTRPELSNIESLTPDQIQVTSDPTEFANQMTAAQSSLGKGGLSVNPYPQESYDKIASEGGKFLRAAGNKILALLKPNGEMVSLVKDATVKTKGAAQAMITKMKDMGGLFMDNYDIYLTPIYEKAGYKVVARVPFNEQYAEAGWDAEDSPLKNKPDVVFMVRKDLAPDQEQSFQEYEDAQAFTQGLIDKAVGEGVAKLPTQISTDNIANELLSELGNPIDTALEAAIPNATKSLEKANIKFQVVDGATDTDSAKAARGNQGLFVAEDGTIIIDKSKLQDEVEAGLVVWHEASHPVMNIIRNTNKPLYDAVVRGLTEAAAKNAGVAGALNWAKSQEQYDNADTQNDEAIVETIGRINSGLIDVANLDAGLRQKLIDFVNSIAKFFGIDPILNDTDLAAFKKTVSQVADALMTGRDISEIVGEDNVGRTESPRKQQRAVTVARGTESMKKFGLNEGRNTTRKIGEALEARTRDKFGIIGRNDRSEGALKKISSWMAEEVKFFVNEFGENSGKGWYGEKFQKGIDAMSKIFPELATDQNSRDLFTMLVAITSDGTEVMQNFKQASMAYQQYKETGKMPDTAKSQRAASYVINFANIQRLLDENNGDVAEVKKKLLEVTSIAELNKQRRLDGVEDLKTSWPASFEVPLAAGVFGPKLGMFYANLSGMENYPTLDRWWSRTFNRYRGTLIPQITRGFNKKGEALGIDAYRQVTGLENASEDEVLAAITRDHDSYEDKGFKNGTVAEKKANTLYKKLFVELNDSPFGRNDRKFMYDAFIDTKKKLKSSGVDVTIADIQAILWYFEKNLYKKLGVTKPIQGISYEDAANTTFEKWSKAGKSFDYSIEKSEEGETIEDIDETEETPEGQASVGNRNLAPNGKPSNLNDKQYQQVRTPEFKNWFGDWENDPANASKVVDENGEPRVVFHGTNETFDEFKKDKLGSKNWMADSARMGFFFAGDRSTSEAYTGMNSMDMMGVSMGVYDDVFKKYKEELDKASKAVSDVYNRILEEEKSRAANDLKDIAKNLKDQGIDEVTVEALMQTLRPMRTDLQKASDLAKEENDKNGNNDKLAEVNEKLYAEIEDSWKKKTGANPRILELFLNIRNPLTVDYSNIEDTNLPSDIQEAIGTGKDGVIFNNLKDGAEADDIFVALEPNQIKSAIGNSGAFSTTDNRIQASVGNRDMINWEKLKPGKGDPKISSRNPIVTKAAADLKDGKITNEEYRAVASENNPIRPITRFFEPATKSEVYNALSSDKLDKIDAPIQDGSPVGIRLDIPAFKNNNTWVVSVHEGNTNAGKSISYSNVARITDVNFGLEPKAGLKIAAGESKSTIGRIFGKWQNLEGDNMEGKGETAKQIIQDTVGNPDWVQVGFNPFRHSYFYDRSSDMGRPIVSADEVVQIGGLVYAKKPTYGNWTDESYRVKGLFDKAGAPVQFSVGNRPESSVPFKVASFVMRKLGEGANKSEIAQGVMSATGMSAEEVKKVMADPEQYIRDSFPELSNIAKENLVERAKVQNIYRGRQFGMPINKAFVGAEVPRSKVVEYLNKTKMADKTFMDSVKDFKNKWLNASKGLPDWMMAVKDFAVGRKNIEIARAMKTIEQLKEEANKIGFKDWDAFSKAMVAASEIKRFIPDEDGLVMFDPVRASEGKMFTTPDDMLPAVIPDAIKALPESIRPFAVKMRQQIDGLTKDLIGSGYVTPEQAVTLEKNIGQYVNRAYKMFNERGFKPNPDQVVDAIKFIADQKFKQILSELFPAGKPSKSKAVSDFKGNVIDADSVNIDELYNQAVEEAKKDVQAIVDKKRNPYFNAKTDSRDTGILKEKKDIPEPIRKLMGEYTDPGTVFVMTVAKQAALASQSEYLNKLREFGMGSIFYEKNDKNRPAEFSVEVAPTGSETKNPLGGLYTTPEISEALEMADPSYNELTNMWMKLVGAVRWGKTVGSVATQAKNFESNIGFAVLNGMFLTGDNTQALKAASKYVKGQYSKAEMDAITEKAVKLNLVGQSVGARELSSMLGSGDIHDIALEIAANPNNAWGKKVKKNINVFGAANKLYRMGDDFWKVYAYINERETVARGRYKTSYESLSKEDQDKVDIESSERVKNTWPTYDRVVEAAKYVSKRAPIFGNFISFQAESLRVLANSIKMAREDMKDPQMKAAGIKRAVGIMTYIGLRTAITYGAAQAAGMATSGILGAAFGDDDEEQKKRAFKKAMPIYARTADIAVVPTDAPHKFTAFSLSSLDPYGIVPNSLNAFTEGREGIFSKEMQPGVKAATAEFFSGFLEPEMTFSTMYSVMNNINPKTGRPIVLDSDTDAEVAAKVASFVMGQLEPSTLSMIERGMERGWTPELASFAGARPIDIDLHKSFGFAMTDMGKQMDAIKAQYNSIKYNEKSTEAEKAEAELEAERKKAFLISKVAETYRDFIKVGASPKVLDEMINERSSIKTTGFDKVTKMGIKTGEVKSEKLFK
jgi:uncharacterized protein (UPF0335 family)